MRANSNHNGLSESNKDISSELTDKISLAANKTIAFFESKLEKDGSYGSEAKDIACYYKSPMMFIHAGKLDLAKQVLERIKKMYMQKNGDFSSSHTIKSIKPEYVEYWSYTNGWILRAANQIKMTEMSDHGYDYLKQFHVGIDAGFLTNNPESKTDMTDVLTTAHHGLLNLERGNLDLAIQAGNYLCHAINKQPDIQKGFYLRFDKTKLPIVDQSAFYFINKTEPNQLYFMIGYPCAYLALLYQATGNQNFLKAAKEYLDFSLSCHENVYQCNFSHKIAWAASIVYSIIPENKYLEAIQRITDYFINNQSNTGIWSRTTISILNMTKALRLLVGFWILQKIFKK